MTQLLQFPVLTKISTLQHAISTRHGGSSTRSYASLNLGFHIGDEVESVIENRQVLARQLGFDLEHLTCAQQTHGANIEIITNENRGRGALSWDSAIPDCDALMTSATQTPLMILVADCAPLLLVDGRNRALAVVHAGWRGAISRIASKTVHKMTQNFGTNAEDLRVGIGPTLCVACFQIGNEGAEAAQEIAPHSITRNGKNPHFDVRELLREDLRTVRVLDTQIETMNRCPKCETETFFSHRNENGRTGRFGLVAWWKS